MKRVFANSAEAIHRFAQQSQNEGVSSSRSIKFNGTKCYSYGTHYLLAEFLDSNTVWINDDFASVTTSKHTREMWSATSHFRQYLKSQTDSETVYAELDDLFKSLGKARKPQLYTDKIEYLWSKFNAYLVERKVKGVKNRRGYKKYAKLIAAMQSDLSSLTSEIAKAIEKDRKAARLAKRKREAKRLADKQEAIQKFLNHESLSIAYQYRDEDFLRIEEETVRTSQNLTVSTKTATVLYKLIKAGKDIKGFNIDGYTVIGLNGVLTIGCHKINKQNMIEVGEKLLQMEIS